MHTEFGNFKSYKICKLLQMAPLLEFSYSPSQNCCTMYNPVLYFFKENSKSSLRNATKSARRKILGKYRPFTIILMKEQFRRCVYIIT